MAGRFSFLTRVVPLGLTVAAITLGGSRSDAAGERNFTFLGSGDSHVQYLGVNLLHDGNVAAGRYGGEFDSGAKFYIFCTDFTHWINWSQSYKTLAVEAAVAAPKQDLNPIAGSLTDYFYQSKVSAPPVGGQGTPGGLLSALTVNTPSGTGTTSEPSDYFRDRKVGNDTHSYSTGPGTGPFSLVDRTKAVAYLTNTYLNSASIDTEHVAGVQLAIWDIIQDGGDGFKSGYVQDGGNSGASAKAILDASIFETEAAKNLLNYNVGSTAMWVQSVRSLTNPNDGHAQDFTYVGGYTPLGGPVPEPAFFQMGALLMLGGAAALRMRRKK